MNSLVELPVRQRTANKPAVLAILLLVEFLLAGGATLILRNATANALPSFATFPAPDHNVSGISYDGSSLWITIDGGQMIYQVDEKTNAVRRKIPFFEHESGGSAWDGKYLWQLAWVSKKIYKLDLSSGSILEVFHTPGAGMCSGMTYDGKYLWVANFEDGKIYQIDQTRGGSILRTIDGLSEVTGLAWDGRRLWNGILVGTKSHDEATPYTGFFQERDLSTMQTLRVIPLPGIGPGTSDWLPGGPLSRRFWWYDGFYNRMVRVELPGYRPWTLYTLELLTILAASVLVGVALGRRLFLRALPTYDGPSIAGRR
jgi:hypothetical protein